MNVRSPYSNWLLIGALLGVAYLASCNRATPAHQSLRHIRVQHNWINDVALAGMYSAADKGSYAQAGLEVEVLAGGANVDPVVPVVSGAALIGIHTNATSVLLARSRGIPIRVIATQYKKSPLGFVGKASTGIHDLGSLRGRRVGVIPSSVAALSLVLELNGLNSDDIRQIIVSPGSDMPLLLHDQIDAFVGFATNQTAQLEAAGYKAFFISFDDLGYHQEAYPLFVSESAFDREKPTLRAFLRATEQGLEDAVANPNAAAAATAKFTIGLDIRIQTEVARRQAELIRSEFASERGLLYMNKSTWLTTNNLLVRAGLLKDPVDLDSLLTWEMLPDSAIGR